LNNPQYQNTFLNTNPNYQNVYTLLGSNYNTNIYGCTIYSQYGLKDNNVSNDIIVQDSVLINFKKITGTYFTSANLESYNCCFSNTSADISGSYWAYIDNGNSQYSFTEPANYPFLVSGIDNGYDKSINWLISNKEILNPFSGINIPPNPGNGYSTYTDYELGLFGTNRADYTY
jgi:hypothetical protein